jgi:class 3 adenylate cyclase/tetratricopeptide (TPR) repeat protein
MEGERKTVTALFADLKGSTELLETLDPEEGRAIVEPLLRIMSDAVRRYEGYLVRTTGDGLFALFGAPVAYEDHPQRALYAALQMQQELRTHVQAEAARGRPALEARVGVHTGEVVAYAGEASGKIEYRLIGHTANLASRMESIAPSGSVAISEATAELCEGYFELRGLGPTSVKGVSTPVSVYEVLGPGPLRTHFELSTRRGLTRFVGRERELEQMRRALEQSMAGHGQIVAVVAEAGTGKSRLFYEFKATIPAEWKVLEAYSVSHGKASAWLPVLELLNGYFGITEADDAAARRDKVRAALTTLDAALEDTLPYLFGLLGIVEGPDPLAQMDARIKRQRTLDAIKRSMLHDSLRQPVVVFLEDVHWIDEQTQGLLDVLVDSIASARILLLFNYRPEYHHGWANKSYYSQLRLDPLAGADGAAMLSALLGEGDELSPLKRLIAERTGGNSFFIEEVVQGLFEDGTLVRNGAVRITRSLSQLRLPPTVQGMLAARVDHLARPQKDLLQTLAVIGREARLRLVRGVTSADEGLLSQNLADLCAAEFIYEQPVTGDTEFVFKHALTQEVAYNSLLIEHRKLLHERIGGTMESVFADHLDDYLKDLAHHYRRSNNTVKAIEYLRQAGEQAAVRAFYEEAIEQLNIAMELLVKFDADQARDTRELAIRKALMGPFISVHSLISPEILLNSERLRELCEEAGDARLLAAVLIHLFFYHRSATNLDKAGTYARQALELAERTSGEFEIFCANFTSGLLAAEKGEYPAARQHLERGVGISQHTQDLIIADPSVALGLLNCIGYLVTTCWILGYPDQAHEQAKGLDEMLQRSLPPNAYAIGMHHLLTMRCDFLRDYRSARADAQEALDRSTRSGYRWGIAYGAIGLGRIMVAEGITDPWIEKMEEAMRAAEASWDQHLGKWLAAGAYLNARLLAEGRATVDQAIAAVTAGGSGLFEADLHRLKGEFALMAGELGEAEAAFNCAISVARRQQAKSFELRASISLTRLLAQQGRRGEARTRLANIYNWFTEGFDTADLKNAKALLDELNT